jgi:DNA-binding IclR family transcriptional regulator
MARSGFNSVCVDRQEGKYILDSLTGHIGGQIPLGVGSAGEAILAFMPREESEAVLKINTPRYAAFNELSADELRAKLDDIRQQGYALDEGRLVAGISALAVPILPRGRDVIAALAINMTSARMPRQRVPELVALVRREVESVEANINPLEIVGTSRRED